MEYQTINKCIKVKDSEILMVTKRFAENNLSSVCMKLADNVSDTHYEWTMEAGAYMVMFELPDVFKVDFVNISNLLGFYCSDYVEERNLNSGNLYSVFKKNMKKKLIFSYVIILLLL